MASLRPVSGPPREIHVVLREWLDAPAAEPLVVRTSGSTGVPKDVVLSRAAMLASARAGLERLGGPGHWLLALPADHVAGLQVVLRSLVGGTEAVILDEHEGLEEAVAAIHGAPRYVSLVPTQLQRWVGDRPDVLRAFDRVLLGGAAVSPALLEQAREAGIEVVTTYGMSETCGGCVYDGRPLAGVDVGVEDDGRVTIGGSVLFDGYDGQPELTAQALVDGRLRTQDLGAFDDDGRLVVSGRVDDVVVSGGVNVGLHAVEQRVREHPLVEDAAVVGLDDPEWGSRVVAYAVVHKDLTLDSLRDFVSERLPRPWAPRELRVVPALPLLANGKVDRMSLRVAP